MSASASAGDVSDTEGNVVERSGGDPLPDYVVVVDTGNSITRRCRKRLEWVQGVPGGNKDDWVCEDRNCKRPVCAAYYARENAASELKQSREELEQINTRPPEEQNVVLRFLQRAVKDKQKLVDREQKLLEMKCEIFLIRHETMKEVLINGMAAGNKADHETLYTNKSEIEDELEEADEADADNGGSLPSPSQLFNATSMYGRVEDYAIPASLDELFDGLDIGTEDPRREEMQEFYNYCDKLFSRSIESTNEYMSTDYAKDIQKTVTAIVEWQMGKKVLRSTEAYRPSSQAQETRGVHPILLALMWKINSVLKGSAHLTLEQYLPKQLQKSKRWMDALLSKAVQHFLSSANGNLIEKSCEFKPISRGGDGYKKMVEDGLNQHLGHNLQVLWDSCYQFCGGLGKDGETSGIVLTMISASLLGSKLTGVGTKDVDLKISCGAHMPLFSEQTTKKLATGVDFESLGLSFSPDLPMAPGFMALIDFISNEGTPQDTIDLSLASGDSIISADAVEYLGSGAFCSVYKCSRDGETQAVLKMSKNWDSTTLESELRALKALTHEAIPKLSQEDLVKVTVKARCEKKQVNGLLLDLPIGKSLQQKPNYVQVQEVLNAIEDVLNYANGMGWFHLDVQPSNILVVVNDDGTHRYILIDWGMAVNETKALTSFHGSPPFSHPDMLLVKKKKKDAWRGPRPHAKFDRFSLAMTLAYIEHKGVPWSGFHKKVVTDDMLEDRYKKAVNLIEKSGLDNASKEKVLNWIPKPAKQTPSSQPQTPRGQATTGVRGRKRKSNTEDEGAH